MHGNESQPYQTAELLIEQVEDITPWKGHDEHLHVSFLPEKAKRIGLESFSTTMVWFELRR